MAHFEASTSAEPDRVVVALTGECDLDGRDRLTDVLLAALGAADTVVVDVSAVTFIDSSGLHALISAHHAAQRDGRRLYVVNPHGPVAAVLELTGVGALLHPPVDDSDRSA